MAGWDLVRMQLRETLRLVDANGKVDSIQTLLFTPVRAPTETDIRVSKSGASPELFQEMGRTATGAGICVAHRARRAINAMNLGMGCKCEWRVNSVGGTNGGAIDSLKANWASEKDLRGMRMW